MDVPVIVVTAKELTAEDVRILSGQTDRIIAKDQAYLTEVAVAVRGRLARRAARRSGARRQLKSELNGKNTWPRILLVEDNEMNRDMLSRRLIRNGYEVCLAVDGQQGADMAVSERPDLILMDMSLPVIDGWEATRRIKANDATRPIPVIALTAHAMAGDREKAMEVGCEDYDTKPVEISRLLGKIAALLAPKMA